MGFNLFGSKKESTLQPCDRCDRMHFNGHLERVGNPVKSPITGTCPWCGKGLYNDTEIHTSCLEAKKKAGWV